MWQTLPDRSVPNGRFSTGTGQGRRILCSKKVQQARGYDQLPVKHQFAIGAITGPSCNSRCMNRQKQSQCNKGYSAAANSVHAGLQLLASLVPVHLYTK